MIEINPGMVTLSASDIYCREDHTLCRFADGVGCGALCYAPNTLYPDNAHCCLFDKPLISHGEIPVRCAPCLVTERKVGEAE